MPRRSPDVVRHLVFGTGATRRLTLFWTVIAAAGLSLTYPVYAWVGTARPLVLGVPASLAWVVAWLVVVFFAVLALYRTGPDNARPAPRGPGTNGVDASSSSPSDRS